MGLPDYSRIVWKNVVWAAGTSVVATSESPGWEASNLKSKNRYPGWRSAPVSTGQSLQFEFTSQPVSVVAVVDTAIPAGGSIIVEYWTGAAWAAFTADSPSTFPFPAFNPGEMSILWFPVGRVTTGLRVSFINPGILTTMQAGAVFAGLYTELEFGIAPSSSVEWVDPSLITETEGGQQHAWVRRKLRRVTTLAPSCRPAMATQLEEIVDTVGGCTPILYAVDPANLKRCYMGYLSTSVSDTHKGHDRWDIALALKEAR